MTIEDTYGTRADLMPQSMIKLVKSPPGSERLLSWVGREGVEFLPLAEHERYERESLRAYPRLSDGSVAWGTLTPDPRIRSVDEDSVDPVDFVAEFTQSARDVVVLWGDITVPSVRMDGSTLSRYLSDIVASFPDFWMYLPAERIMLERSFDGVMTASHLPAHPSAG
ncbi:hypothetical protein OG394_39945 [Kribbella sp. NBC_01245]|uniref:hypothetical protein n=1 Tax=Kribbella sp. NBC_01245 TaxID=2903578 RepID=UPI002E286AA5|nr:hypothetical protein [Kribbella sp. NBC_01245]